LRTGDSGVWGKEGGVEFNTVDDATLIALKYKKKTLKQQLQRQQC